MAFRLIDREDPESNTHLDFVIRDAATTLAALRAEGHVVLLHCVAAQSRTPTVATAYSLLRGIPLDQAYEAVTGALPSARPNAAFLEALRRIAATFES